VNRCEGLRTPQTRVRIPELPREKPKNSWPPRDFDIVEVVGSNPIPPTVKPRKIETYGAFFFLGFVQVTCTDSRAVLVPDRYTSLLPQPPGDDQRSGWVGRRDLRYKPRACRYRFTTFNLSTPHTFDGKIALTFSPHSGKMSVDRSVP